MTDTDTRGLPLFAEGTLGTVAHEYCHAFANPLVERFATELAEPAWLVCVEGHEWQKR